MLVSLLAILDDVDLASWVTNHDVLLGFETVRNCDHREMHFAPISLKLEYPLGRRLIKVLLDHQIELTVDLRIY